VGIVADYRKTTEKERRTLELSRDLMQQGIEGERDMLAKISPTMAKSARDDIRRAEAMRKSVPASAREGEAYDYAGYKKGGKVSKYADGGGIGRKVMDYLNPKRPMTPQNEQEFADMVSNMSPVGSVRKAAASAVSKRATKASLKEAEDIAEAFSKNKADDMAKYKVQNPNYSGDAPRRSPGYRDFETTSPRLSDEYAKGGKVSKYAKGGYVSSADGCAQRGKTKGRMI
jgi:hypothetical protein